MFRFSIRDVLWAMVVVALGIAWWLEHQAGWHAKEDARTLALYSVDSRAEGFFAQAVYHLQVKYKVREPLVFGPEVNRIRASEANSEVNPPRQ